MCYFKTLYLLCPYAHIIYAYLFSPEFSFVSYFHQITLDILTLFHSLNISIKFLHCLNSHHWSSHCLTELSYKSQLAETFNPAFTIWIKIPTWVCMCVLAEKVWILNGFRSECIQLYFCCDDTACHLNMYVITNIQSISSYCLPREVC